MLRKGKKAARSNFLHPFHFYVPEVVATKWWLEAFVRDSIPSLLEPEICFDHFVVLALGLNQSFCRGGGFDWSDCSYKHLFQLLHVNWKGDCKTTYMFVFACTYYILAIVCVKPVDSAEVDVSFFVCMQRPVLHRWGLSRRWGSVGKALLLLALHEDLGHWMLTFSLGLTTDCRFIQLQGHKTS